MARDGRDILEVLKFELQFLEQGGYGRSVQTPWKPTSLFQDSVTCLNYGEPSRPHPCSECLLIDFVPELSRSETIPCHHIPIGPSGQSLETLDRGYNQAQVEEALIGWLRDMISHLEKVRAAR